MTDDSEDWRKASFSGPQDDCVTVHRKLNAVRDSKNPANVLSVPNFRQSIRFIRATGLAPAAN